MHFHEALKNWLVGLSVLSWAFLGLLESAPSERFTTARLCCFLLNTCIGCLFIFRRPLRCDGTLFAIGLSLPSLVIGGIAFKTAPALDQWPRVAECVFVLGTAVSLIAFGWLGRSFAILPAVRRIVVGGPYRLVRHPAYLGELMLVLGCCVASMTWFAPLLFACALAAVVIRIRAEEDVLSRSQQYREYRALVRTRLVPFVW